MVDSSLEDLFHHLFQAPTVTDQLTILSRYEEAEVVKIRRKTDGHEAATWRIKMCCDVNLVNRVHAKRGRGNVDILGRGVKAAVRQRASDLACGTSVIWLNLRIFKTFFQNGSPEYTILEDKGFYKAALRAPNALTAIKNFLQKRRKYGADFRVSDAERWAIKRREHQRQRQAYGRIKRSELIPHLEHDLTKLIEMKRAFPDQKLAVRLYDPMIETLRDQITDILESTTAERLRSICQAEPTSVFSEQDLAKQTGLAVGNIRYYMRQLEDERAVYQVSATSWQVPQHAPKREIHLYTQFG